MFATSRIYPSRRFIQGRSFPWKQSDQRVKILRLFPAPAVVVALGLLISGLAVGAAELQPRRAANKAAYTGVPAGTVVERVVIKFHEGTRVRLRQRVLVALDREERQKGALGGLGLTAARVASDVAEALMLVELHPRVKGLGRLFSAAEEVLAARKASGEARSGRQLADLSLYYELALEPGTRAGDLDQLLAGLNALDSIEIAYAEAPAKPATTGIDLLAPAAEKSGTPDFQDLQLYLEPAPLGIDAYYAWTIPGGKGQGVQIVDAEWGWRITHEDMPPLSPSSDPNSSSQSARNHGTAVLGIMVAVDNGFGVTGIANQAQAGFESVVENGSTDVPDAINDAAMAAGNGDIIVVEVHRQGPATPDSDCDSDCDWHCDYIAVEYEQADYDAIVAATANGTQVVEPAGNGQTDLDDPKYGGAFDRTVRDSGAILVAASESTGRFPTCFTNWGSRIDVHGWGRDVVTMGKGDLFDGDLPGGDEDRFYTAIFGGTSSAAPIVAGAAASVQGAALAGGLGIQDPLSIRQLLSDTGTPQDSGTKNIGPLPDLRSALDVLLADNHPPVCEDDYFSTPEGTGLTILFNRDLLPNDHDPDGDFLRVVDYDLPTEYGGRNNTGSPFGFVYTPPDSFIGRDSFTYTISDRADGSGFYDTCDVFVDVGCDPIFLDNFDDGDFDHWSGTAVAGNATLEVTADAAMEGSFGMQIGVEGADDRAFVRDQTPASETFYRARFLLRFDAAMSSGSLHRILSIQDASPATNVVLLNMRKSGLLTQLRAQARRDNGTWAYASWVTVPPETSIEVRVEWRAADPGQSNGSLDFSVDGQVQSLTGLDNDSFQVDRTFLGLVNGVDAGTNGDFHFDGFASCRD